MRLVGGIAAVVVVVLVLLLMSCCCCVDGWVAPNSMVPGALISYLWWIFTGSLAIAGIKKFKYEDYYDYYDDYSNDEDTNNDNQRRKSIHYLKPQHHQHRLREAEDMWREAMNQLGKVKRTEGGINKYNGNGDNISQGYGLVRNKRHQEGNAYQDETAERNQQMETKGIQEGEVVVVDETTADIEASSSRVWEMERKLQVLARNLDSNRCLEKFLCHLKHHHNRRHEELLLLEIFDTSLSTPGADCRGSFTTCPLGEARLTTLFRNSWKGSNRLLED
ncbi:hypothetical protein Pmani_019365 [Petrolisthes manimaculis]|uniref:Uncharacterized protein n=1 Tax=Petrolisthes manimaculis TaxID=1843537 RepID=A0AAE1U3L9_9EUCA|nr:hypothetical protein Pmani_019365 [Petrolisthes manimaculis]